MLIPYIKKATRGESFKRAFWSTIILIFSYLMISGPNLFNQAPY